MSSSKGCLGFGGKNYYHDGDCGGGGDGQPSSLSRVG